MKHGSSMTIKADFNPFRSPDTGETMSVITIHFVLLIIPVRNMPPIKLFTKQTGQSQLSKQHDRFL